MQLCFLTPCLRHCEHANFSILATGGIFRGDKDCLTTGFLPFQFFNIIPESPRDNLPESFSYPPVFAFVASSFSTSDKLHGRNATQGARRIRLIRLKNWFYVLKCFFVRFEIASASFFTILLEFATMPLKLFVIAPLILSVLGLGSCAPFRPDPVPDVASDIPATFSAETGTAAPETKWWTSFDDPELNSFIESAFSKSPELEQVYARLRQARAVAEIAGADLYPDLTGTGDLGYSRRRIKNGISDTFSSRNYSAGLSGSYEPDLWGKIRAEREASLLSVEAREQDLNFAALLLAGEISDRWIRIVSQKMQIALLEEQLETNFTFLELIVLRFRQAIVSALDVYQQQQVIDRLRAEIPLAQAEKERLINELAVLAGNPPRSIVEIGRERLPKLTPAPPAGIPADLLEYRPDIRAVQARLRAAGWDVAAARANRLPSVSLKAGGFIDGDHLDFLLDNWILTLASGIAAPIFDGNRRAAEVDRTEAVVDENLAFYRETVLVAIREVENALVTEARQLEHIEKLKKVVETARIALRQAVLRYRNGLTDYLPVLTQILTVQDLERNLIVQRETLLRNRVNLHLALGGTWASEILPPTLAPAPET